MSAAIINNKWGIHPLKTVVHVSPHVPWLQYLRTALHRCHRHTATAPTTALLSAVVPHHNTTTQGGGGEEGKKYRYSICNYNYTLCHVSCHIKISYYFTTT